MLRIFILFTLCTLLSISTKAQSRSAYGLRGGFTLATQKWNNFQRQPLFAYHLDLSAEWMSEWKRKSEQSTLNSAGFLALVGYHQRGSAFSNFFNNGQRPVNVFHNLELILAGKVAYQKNIWAPYYCGGVRLAYTLKSELVYNYATNHVRPFNWGMYLGAGTELNLDKLPVAFTLELSLLPDFSNQVFIPPHRGEVITATGKEYRDFPEEKVTNLSFELSLGVKTKRTQHSKPQEL